VHLSDRREDKITVEYRYVQGSNESLYIDTFLKIYRGLSAYWENERNLYDDKNIRTVIGFSYVSQCWSVDFSYTDEEEGERKYKFIVRLHGLSG
jgi:hypothetical protein